METAAKREFHQFRKHKIVYLHAVSEIEKKFIHLVQKIIRNDRSESFLYLAREIEKLNKHSVYAQLAHALAHYCSVVTEVQVRHHEIQRYLDLASRAKDSDGHAGACWLRRTRFILKRRMFDELFHYDFD